MIDVRAVTNAVLARLRTLDIEVGDATAPPGKPSTYVTLESPPGSVRAGTVTDPEQGAVLRFRVRAVARSQQAGVARQEAQRLAHLCATALMDRTVPIDGDGWEITGRAYTPSGGVDSQGDLVNVIDDYDLTVSAA